MNDAMNDTFETFGRTDKSGRINIAGRQQLDQWSAGHPNSRIKITVEVIEQRGKIPSVGYYYKNIVPVFQRVMKEQGDIRTLNAVDRELRGGFAPFRDDPDGHRKPEKWKMFMEHLERLAAEVFDVQDWETPNN